MPLSQIRPAVRATHCEYQADDESVYQALRRATDPLTRTWERLQRADRIGIKLNQDQLVKNHIRHEGQLQQLVSEKAARALLRLLREKTSAELVCVDVSFYAIYQDTDPQETGALLPVLREFDVEFVDAAQPPYCRREVPGGGQMFSSYLVPQAAADADEFVSVAKMKNHGFMGITLALKNLFGLMPSEPQGHCRHYYHHLVRMPYMLADLGRLYDPVLNVVDGMVGQAGQEWRHGPNDAPVRIGNVLVAGDQVIATDACGAHLMGHDPQADWPTPPYHRDRNPLLVAAEGGFGTVDLQEIDFSSEVASPVADFYANQTDTEERVVSWRRTTCEQALFYRDHRDELLSKYAGEYILLQQNEVRWHNKDSRLRRSRRKLSGANPQEAMWLKYVDPEEAEGEHFEVYEQTLVRLEALGL